MDIRTEVTMKGEHDVVWMSATDDVGCRVNHRYQSVTERPLKHSVWHMTEAETHPLAVRGT